MVIEHDDKGKFSKGNRGGPGRPKKAKEERYWAVLLSSVSMDDWKTIVGKAVEQAKRGDDKARKFIADYLIGPPVQKQEVTGKDGGPILMVNWDENAPDDTDPG